MKVHGNQNSLKLNTTSQIDEHTDNLNILRQKYYYNKKEERSWEEINAEKSN
jgi:hypothetical protein